MPTFQAKARGIRALDQFGSECGETGPLDGAGKKGRTPGVAAILVIGLALFTVLVPAASGAEVEKSVPEDQDLPAAELESDDVGDAAGEEDAGEESEPTEKDDRDWLHIGGALRFNAFYKSWEGEEENRDKLGDIAFDTFRINVDGSYKEIDVSAEYRFYSGYNMLHHGYVGHTFSNKTLVLVGLFRNPFGLLPYASHNWFFNITYYLGMEDDYDVGVGVVYPSQKFDFQLAFFKNSEGSFTGDSIDSARYSYDLVHTDENELGYAGVESPRTNEEVNQFNVRFAYPFSHGNAGTTEVGISGEYGGIYNSTTNETGDRWAAALHLNGNYGRFNVMLQALGYEFRPENPEGQDDQFVVMGAYDAPYKVASKGAIYLANVSYTLPFEKRIVDSIAFYNDYSYLAKDVIGYEDSQQNVLGLLVTTGRLLTYVDFAFGKNHPWVGPNYGFALAEGDPNADWELRFNINIGYYY